MNRDQKIVLFIFAGRQVNMEIQMPYLYRLLDEWPGLEVDLWDLTRSQADINWIRHEVAGVKPKYGERIKVRHHLHPGHPFPCKNPQNRKGRQWRCTCMKHKPPYEEPYKFYAQHGEDHTVYVKIDDDVLFLQTDRFEDLIAPLEQHPNRVISANVVNNAVCAKYEPDLSWRLRMPGVEDALPNPALPRNDKAWWALHTEAAFAKYSHAWFFDQCGQHFWGAGPFESRYVRTRPGEAISINCIAFTQSTMERLATAFTSHQRLGDEGAVDQMLPWIAQDFYAAHLTFGPQDQRIPYRELQDIREKYKAIREVYLR